MVWITAVDNDQSSLYLSLDQGGHSSRAMVISASGQVVAQASENVATHRTGADRVEQDPQQLLSSLRRCCDAIASQMGVEVKKIVAAGLAAQRSSVLCWQRDDGSPLTPVLSWQDRRAAEFIESFEDQKSQVKAVTGLVLSPHYGASKLNWCLTNERQVQEALEQNNLTLGPLASFLTRHLVSADINDARDVCDPTNASRTLLWDSHSCKWSEALCELFGVDSQLLPRCVDNLYSYGDISLGEYRVPLCYVGGDQAAALYAFGKPQPGTVYINLGTGAFIQTSVIDEGASDERLLRSVVLKDSDTLSYVLEGTVNGAGSALSWFAQKNNGEVRELLDLGELEVASGAEVPLFLNGISGLGSPLWRSDFPSRFLGSGSSAVKMIAVLESIAFLIQLNILEMKKTQRLDEIVLTGGLSQNNYLCRAIEILSGMSVLRSDTKEATALGVAYCLAQQPSREVNLEPISSISLDATVLNERFERWSAAMHQAIG